MSEFIEFIRQNVLDLNEVKFITPYNPEWEDSDLLEMLNKKFFFIIFQYNKKTKSYLLKKVMFWNMPYNDLEIQVRGVFEDTKKKILD